MVEYGVVIRRQFPQGELRWQLWLGSGMVQEHSAFLKVMNHAGAMGFEAVAAGHFDELGVPEVLLQRKMEASAFAKAEPAPSATAAAATRAQASPAATPARSTTKPAAKAAAKPAAKKKPSSPAAKA